MTEDEAMKEPKKVVAAPVDPGPVVSQAAPAATDATPPTAPTPDAPIVLSQVLDHIYL